MKRPTGPGISRTFYANVRWSWQPGRGKVDRMALLRPRFCSGPRRKGSFVWVSQHYETGLCSIVAFTVICRSFHIQCCDFPSTMPGRELSLNYGPLSSLSDAFDGKVQALNATFEKWQQQEISWAAKLRVHVQVLHQFFYYPRSNKSSSFLFEVPLLTPIAGFPSSWQRGILSLLERECAII